MKLNVFLRHVAYTVLFSPECSLLHKSNFFFVFKPYSHFFIRFFDTSHSAVLYINVIFFDTNHSVVLYINVIFFDTSHSVVLYINVIFFDTSHSVVLYINVIFFLYEPFRCAIY